MRENGAQIFKETLTPVDPVWISQRLSTGNRLMDNFVEIFCI